MSKKPQSRIGERSNTGFPIKCGLCCLILLLASRVHSQNSKVLPEWKDHFRATPVIANCVFERRIKHASASDETNLYQFRYQANAFMMREIRSLDEAASNRTAIVSVYAGRFGSNYWAISPREILTFFPNAERMMKERKNAHAASVYGAESMMYSALYYGINRLDPTTVKWPEETKFTALAISGESLSGEVLETSGGRPTLLEWHFEQRPDTHFILEYGYDLQLGLSYYPSEIRLYRKEGNKERTLGAVHRILVLNTSATPLGEEFFGATNHIGSRAITVVFTNNDIYTVTPSGKLTKVLRVSELPPDVPATRARRKE